MQCDLWFPTPVWSKVLDIDNNKIYNLCKLKQSQDTGRIISNQYGWQSKDIEISKETLLQELLDNIYFCSAAALDCYKFDTKHKRLAITSLWININDNDYSYNKVHVHAGGVLSGVYYVKCADQSGKLCFPRNANEEYILNSTGEVVESNTFNYGEAKYSPMEKKLILFPAWVPHYVENNADGKERISISFNLGLYNE